MYIYKLTYVYLHFLGERQIVNSLIALTLKDILNVILPLSLFFFFIGSPLFIIRAQPSFSHFSDQIIYALLFLLLFLLTLKPWQWSTIHFLSFCSNSKICTQDLELETSYEKEQEEFFSLGLGYLTQYDLSQFN